MATRNPIITDQAAENITKVEELAYELRIHEVMTENVLCLSPDLSMKEAVDTFQRDRISGAPVTGRGQPDRHPEYGRPDAGVAGKRVSLTCQRLHVL